MSKWKQKIYRKQKNKGVNTSINTLDIWYVWYVLIGTKELSDKDNDRLNQGQTLDQILGGKPIVLIR